MELTYTPASDESIASYREDKYPAWVKSCEKRLRNLHKTLGDEAGPPVFRFGVVNDGNRPGKER